jgi:hypothetical protein
VNFCRIKKLTYHVQFEVLPTFIMYLKKSISVYQTTRGHTPQDNSHHRNLHENLRPRVCLLLTFGCSLPSLRLMICTCFGQEQAAVACSQTPAASGGGGLARNHLIMTLTMTRLRGIFGCFDYNRFHLPLETLLLGVSELQHLEAQW